MGRLESCNENLKINVNQYDYWCFSSSSNWDNYIHLVKPNEEFIDIVLDCSMDDKVLVKDISSGLIRITVLCSKGYKFVSNDSVLMTIFNERMESKRTDDNIPLYMFQVGTYYLEVKLNSDEINSEITINYGLESSLTAQLFNMEEREVPASVIGELVMKKLKEVDEVAYVRFASVYREFKDVNAFMDELAVFLKNK